MLASWLDVQPDWLRFGTETPRGDSSLPSEDFGLLKDLQLLDETHKLLVREMVVILLGANENRQGNKKGG